MSPADIASELSLNGKGKDKDPVVARTPHDFKTSCLFFTTYCSMVAMHQSKSTALRPDAERHSIAERQAGTIRQQRRHLNDG